MYAPQASESLSDLMNELEAPVLGRDRSVIDYHFLLSIHFLKYILDLCMQLRWSSKAHGSGVKNTFLFDQHRVSIKDLSVKDTLVFECVQRRLLASATCVAIALIGMRNWHIGAVLAIAC